MTQKPVIDRQETRRRKLPRIAGSTTTHKIRVVTNEQQLTRLLFNVVFSRSSGFVVRGGGCVYKLL